MGEHIWGKQILREAVGGSIGQFWSAMDSVDLDKLQAFVPTSLHFTPPNISS